MAVTMTVVRVLMLMCVRHALRIHSEEDQPGREDGLRLL